MRRGALRARRARDRVSATGAERPLRGPRRRGRGVPGRGPWPPPALRREAPGLRRRTRCASPSSMSGRATRSCWIPPGGDPVLVDAGPPGPGRRRMLRGRGASSARRAALVTHDQSDHSGGLADVLGFVPVARLGLGDARRLSSEPLAAGRRRGAAAPGGGGRATSGEAAALGSLAARGRAGSAGPLRRDEATPTPSRSCCWPSGGTSRCCSPATPRPRRCRSSPDQSTCSRSPPRQRGRGPGAPAGATVPEARGDLGRRELLRPSHRRDAVRPGRAGVPVARTDDGEVAIEADTAGWREAAAANTLDRWPSRDQARLPDLRHRRGEDLPHPRQAARPRRARGRARRPRAVRGRPGAEGSRRRRPDRLGDGDLADGLAPLPARRRRRGVGQEGRRAGRRGPRRDPARHDDRPGRPRQGAGRR